MKRRENIGFVFLFYHSGFIHYVFIYAIFTWRLSLGVELVNFIICLYLLFLKDIPKTNILYKKSLKLYVAMIYHIFLPLKFLFCFFKIKLRRLVFSLFSDINLFLYKTIVLLHISIYYAVLSSSYAATRTWDRFIHDHVL